jgi:hypothetical protein
MCVLDILSILLSFHSGKTGIGNDFSRAYAEWDKHVELPFIAHLNKVFCESTLHIYTG